MDCLLSANHLRSFFTTLCFGCVFLWILSGQYLDREQQGPRSLSASPVHSRNKAVLARRQSYEQLRPLQTTHAARVYFRRRLLLEAKDHRGLDATAGDEFQRFAFSAADSDSDIDYTTAQCSAVHKVNTSSGRCQYVRRVDSCLNDEGLLVYLDFIYCTIPYKLIPLAMIVLFLWLIFLFIFLGATAEEYFCPALTVMSQVLHLSQNVAGVTLLALGNGAPDIFSAFAAISQSDDHKSSLAIGALFGAGIFVTTVVVGGVAFVTPFELTKRPFLRDIIFYTLSVYWTFYLLWSNTVTVYMAAGFIALYIVYVGVVIVGRILYQRWKGRQTSNKDSDIARPQANTDHQTAFVPPSPLTDGITNGVTKAIKPAISAIPEEREHTHEEEEGGMAVGGMMEGGEKGKGMILQFSDNQRSETETDSEAKVYPGGTLQVTTDNGEVVSPKRPHVYPPLPPLSPNSSDKRAGEQGAGGEGGRKLSGAKAPLFPQLRLLLTPPPVSRRINRSFSPTANQERGWKYAQRQGWLSWEDDRRPRSTSPRKLLRKNLSCALDISEEVGAAVGIPHVPQIWEEIHKVHHHKSPLTNRKSPLTNRKSPLTNRKSPLASRRSPLITVSRGSYHSSHEEGLYESEQDEEMETEAAATDETTPLMLSPPKRPHPFIYLLLALYPFGEDFRELGLVGKLYELLKYPCGVILTLTVPVIDHSAELHNWNRWLNILHCVTGPTVVALLTKRGLYLIGGVFPVWTVVLIVGVGVAIVVACTSRNDRRPVYHCVFAWLGFAISMVWIYVIANEIVNLLQAFGVVVKLSDGILGITLLAWGNSIGDAVANMTMARQGFPRMAIGACYGGPLLNILIGVGVASLYKSVKRKADGFQFKLYFTQVEFFAAVFLMAALSMSMATITLSRFRVFRPFAVFLMAFYVVFLVVAILAEIPVFNISISGVLL